ncbi:uncharacterized protein F4822DRAFT_440357 [Hypoxylon trugodes]|uniref:uncharacterized protein n=1 Tax=Hypoxylon trugodes TaxID=326681 RepID=UPI002190B4AF|nr:uncharacterized protein F4822DRAFT_440357 [Hypoxylon trugodes]KAI1384225.1 hypothetical protein F4822DRAFT_440357 [Hypoxylon trugodes]
MGEETLVSLLCAEPWHLDSNNECQISFQKDYTGETEWRLLDPDIAIGELNEGISNRDDSSTRTSDRPRLLSKFKIEITLTKRHITSRGSLDHVTINDERLTDAAFGTKTYYARLEMGCFRTAFERRAHNVPEWAPPFAYQLSLDESPYPARQLWKDPDEAPEPEWFPFTEWKEFCSGKIVKQV